MKDSRRMISDEISCANGAGAAAVDAAFRKITKNCTAFLIWKVETSNLVAIHRDQYGTFFDTDSYIIFAASQYGQPCGVDTVPRELKIGNLEYHIHFWIGSETVPERSGVAAYKTVELDNLVGNCATQHRETEGNESPRFLSYFKNGIKIIKPEYIQQVQPYPPKLYRVSGKRAPILKEMPKVSWDYFNSSDMFVIHTPNTIFLWIGRASNTIEKLHATKIALDIKDENKISNIIFVDDGYEKTLSDDVKKEFSKFLSLDKRMILPENIETDQNGNFQKYPMKLYRCSENNGKYRVTEIKNGPFHQYDFNSDDVYIVDHEAHGIWVWVGRSASDKERSEALRNARGFVKKKKYPGKTKVTRVVDGYEPVEFRMLISSWKDDYKPAKPTVLVSKYDAVTMEERPALAAETQLIDDGNGSLTIWRTKQSQIVEITKDRHGFFFSGDCYVILYTYQTSSPEPKHLLYCWLGLHASQDEINSTTLKMTEIDEELGLLGFQARIIQGRETAHFLQLFKGKLMIFKGKGTDFDDSGKNLKNPSQYLLQVCGSTTYSSKAVQVSVKASSFNSNYCFILKRGKKAYIWCGSYSTGDQREMAKGFAGKDFELVLEGKEKDDFFSLLGGKTPYSTQMVKTDCDPKPPRLFQCSSSKGVFYKEIMFYTQKDLLPEHVMLLDTNEAIYVWIGKLSSREDQRLSVQTVLEFLQTDPSGRDMNIAIINIKQEKEPPTFIGFFPTWDRKYWKEYKTFSRVKQEIEIQQNGISNTDQNGFIDCQKSEHSDFDQFEKYPINILKEPNDKLPTRINPLNKELHLTHDDFVSLFKIPYLEFEKLPRWKQQEMKKKVGLF